MLATQTENHRVELSIPCQLPALPSISGDVSTAVIRWRPTAAPRCAPVGEKNSDNAAISGADVPQHWGEHRRTCVLQMPACGAEHLTNDAATSNQACREAFSWLSCTAHNVVLVTWGDGVGYVATVIDVFVLGWALVTERGFLWPQELPVHEEQCR
jgi:hypothetical protein